MSVHIVYDSAYGNTKKVSEMIQSILEEFNHDVVLYNVKTITQKVFHNCDVLLIGSPTRAFQPTMSIKRFIKHIPKDFNGLIGVFDTRLSKEESNHGIFGFFTRRFGYASGTMLKKLKKRGFRLKFDPFYVEVSNVDGPLKEGEANRLRPIIVSIHNVIS